MINNPLSTRQQDICGYAGTFGVLVGLTSLIQHVVMTRSHWITFCLAGIYLFIIAAFLLLALQKSVAPVLLIAAAALSLIAELVLATNAIFSLIVLLLFIYTAVITVVLYVEQIPRLLKQKTLLIKAEKDLWKDKI